MYKRQAKKSEPQRLLKKKNGRAGPLRAAGIHKPCDVDSRSSPKWEAPPSKARGGKLGQSYCALSLGDPSQGGESPTQGGIPWPFEKRLQGASLHLDGAVKVEQRRSGLNPDHCGTRAPKWWEFPTTSAFLDFTPPPASRAPRLPCAPSPWRRCRGRARRSFEPPRRWRRPRARAPASGSPPA